MENDASPPAPPAPFRSSPTGRKLRSFLTTLLWFVLAGPPCGSIVFAASFALAIAPVGDAGSVFGFLLIYGVPFSYWMGVPSALAAGLLVGALRWWRGAAGLAAALMIGLAVGVATVVITSGTGTGSSGAGLPLLAACLGATIACWRLSGGSRRTS